MTYIHVCMCVHLLSHVQLFATPWTLACRAPFSEIFPGKNTGAGCHFPFQGFFPSQGSNLHLFIYMQVKGSAQSLAHSYILNKCEPI